MPMTHVVTVIPYPQEVSDFEHEINANGSPHCHTSVPSKLVSDFELEFSANSSHYHSDSVSSGCG